MTSLLSCHIRQPGRHIDRPMSGLAATLRLLIAFALAAAPRTPLPYCRLNITDITIPYTIIRFLLSAISRCHCRQEGQLAMKKRYAAAMPYEEATAALQMRGHSHATPRHVAAIWWHWYIDSIGIRIIHWIAITPLRHLPYIGISHYWLRYACISAPHIMPTPADVGCRYRLPLVDAHTIHAAADDIFTRRLLLHRLHVTGHMYSFSVFAS